PAASICALFDPVCWSRGPVGETLASAREAATEYEYCNCSSAFLDTRGARSLVSRIFSSSAITSSSAGCIIWNEHPKFRTALKSLCAMRDLRLGLGSH